MAYVKFHVKTAAGSRNLREHLNTDSMQIAAIELGAGTPESIYLVASNIVTTSNAVTLTNKTIPESQLTQGAMQQVLAQHMSAVWQQVDTFAVPSGAISVNVTDRVTTLADIDTPVFVVSQPTTTKGILGTSSTNTLATSLGGLADNYVVQLRHSATGKTVDDGVGGSVYGQLINGNSESALSGTFYGDGDSLVTTSVDCTLILQVGDVITYTMNSLPQRSVISSIAPDGLSFTVVGGLPAHDMFMTNVMRVRWTLYFTKYGIPFDPFAFPAGEDIDFLYAEVYDYADRPWQADLYGAGFVDVLITPEAQLNFSDILGSVANSQFNAYSNLVWDSRIYSTFTAASAGNVAHYSLTFAGEPHAYATVSFTAATGRTVYITCGEFTTNSEAADLLITEINKSPANGGFSDLISTATQTNGVITIDYVAVGPQNPSVTYVGPGSLTKTLILAGTAVVIPGVSSADHAHQYSEMLGTIPNADFDAYGNLAVSSRLYSSFTAPVVPQNEIQQIVTSAIPLNGTDSAEMRFDYIAGNVQCTGVFTTMEDFTIALNSAYRVVWPNGLDGTHVTVINTTGTTFTVEWQNSLGNTNIDTPSIGSHPGIDSVVVTTLQEGGNITVIPGVSTADHVHQYSEILNHVEAYSDLATHNRIYNDMTPIGAAENEDVSITFSASPASGSFTFYFANQNITIDVTTPTVDVQAAIDAIWGAGNLTLERNNAVFFFICSGTLAATYFPAPIVSTNNVQDAELNYLTVASVVGWAGRPEVIEGVASNHHTHTWADITDPNTLNAYQQLLDEHRVDAEGTAGVLTAATSEVQEITVNGAVSEGNIQISLPGVALPISQNFITDKVATLTALADAITASGLYTAVQHSFDDYILITRNDNTNIEPIRIISSTLSDGTTLASAHVDVLTEGTAEVLSGVANRSHTHDTLAPRMFRTGLEILSPGEIGYIDAGGVVRKALSNIANINLKRLVVSVGITTQNFMAPFYVLPSSVVTTLNRTFDGYVVGQELYLGESVSYPVPDLPTGAGSHRILVGYVVSPTKWEFMQPQYLESIPA